ncbi:hypothetical protein ACU686_22835 [Yinghuangia aomiensis]
MGHEPRTELLKGQIDLDEEGYVKVAHPTQHTNLTGVLACGDVVDHIYRQAITAARHRPRRGARRGGGLADLDSTAREAAV